MAKPNVAQRALAKRLTRGRKPKSLPGGAGKKTRAAYKGAVNNPAPPKPPRAKPNPPGSRHKRKFNPKKSIKLPSRAGAGWTPEAVRRFEAQVDTHRVATAMRPVKPAKRRRGILKRK